MDSMPRSSRKSSAAFTPCSFVSSVLSLIRLLRKYEIYQPCFVTVNFAYNDLDVCCYTDLIKVSVAMDDGEILGFDAKGFLVNHYDRDIPEADISQSRAKESVSPRLEIVSGRLALIPTDGLEEKLCYEFRCRAENGRNVLVYINAQTAEEEQILILVESKSGTLTV